MGNVPSAKPRFGKLLTFQVVAAALLSFAGCSVIFPPKYDYATWLVAREGQEAAYSIDQEGVISYEMEGLRIDVKYMTDDDLNKMFPQESGEERYSTNPYTYGNYIDPGPGYVRNRFTLFRVTVNNTGFAKVELDPQRALLTTNRKGDVMQPYGVLSGSAPKNFESYYRSRRGPSGNEYYRFSMRMGIVRTNNYLIDEKVFKEESYDGFIVFDPLDDEIEQVTLHIRDFALKFNAYDKPLETMDLAFAFDRQTSMETYREEAWMVAEEVTRARLSAPSEVSGNVTGDITRDVTAIDAFARTKLDGINSCFSEEFVAGRASEGEMAVRFVILISGLVESAQVLSSSVVSPAVDECVERAVRQWRFKVSTGATPSRRDTLAQAFRPPSAAKVTATSFFEFIDTRLDR